MIPYESKVECNVKTHLVLAFLNFSTSCKSGKNEHTFKHFTSNFKRTINWSNTKLHRIIFYLVTYTYNNFSYSFSRYLIIEWLIRNRACFIFWSFTNLSVTFLINTKKINRIWKSYYKDHANAKRKFFDTNLNIEINNLLNFVQSGWKKPVTKTDLNSGQYYLTLHLNYP